ncbi:T9SS type A sorting domain-containing protein [bacterium]|nr:T9SS type A sorting domain-containing protein [bacterium]
MKTIKLFILPIIATLLLLSSSVCSQEWINHGPWHSSLTGLKYNPHDTTEVWGLSGEGGYWISSDGGEHFTFNSPLIPGIDERSPSNVYFHPEMMDMRFLQFGSYQVDSLYRSSDAGVTWQRIAVPLDTVTISCVHFSKTPPYNIYIGESIWDADHDDALVYSSEDNGDTWQVFHSIESRDQIQTIQTIPNNPDVFFIKSAGYDPLQPETHELQYTLNGGETWIEYHVDYQVHGDVNLSDDFYVDPDDPFHWLSESNVYYGVYQGIHQTWDSGESWEEISGGSPDMGYSLRNFQVDEDWNIYYCANTWYFQSEDHGQTWTSPTDDIGGWRIDFDYMRSFALSLDVSCNPMNPDNRLFANQRGLFRTNDGGESVEMVGRGIGGSSITDLLATENSLFAANKYAGLWRYDDELDGWNHCFARDVTSIIANQIDSDIIYTSGKEIYRYDSTADNYNHVVSWVYIDGAVDAVNSDIIYTHFFGQGFARSMDGGETWDNELSIGWAYSVECDPVVPGKLFVSDRPGLYLSEDYAETFELVNEDAPVFRKIVLHPQGAFYGLTENVDPGRPVENRIFFSENDGVTLSEISTNIPNNEIVDIALHPTNKYYLFAATTDGIYTTWDRGETWTLFQGNWTSPVTAIAFSPDGTDIHIGTQADGIWSFYDYFTDVDDPTDVNQLPTDFEVSAVYPNPFNSTFRVTVELPRSSHLQIELFNINGQLVRSLAEREYSAGIHTLEVGALGIGAGIYFLNVKAMREDAIQRKIVLLK